MRGRGIWAVGLGRVWCVGGRGLAGGGAGGIEDLAGQEEAGKGAIQALTDVATALWQCAEVDWRSARPAADEQPSGVGRV